MSSSKKDLAEELQKARMITQEAKKPSPEVIFFERGLGEGHTGIMVSFHKDYASYTNLVAKTRKYPFLEQLATTSFLVNLNDEIHYRPLTLRTLAENILLLNKEKP